MIVGKDIHKYYDNLHILKGVDITIRSQEVVSIVGKSGSGKSTLLHILGTLDNPSAGKVLLDGQNIEDLSEKQLAAFRNNNIGLVFQFHHLLPEFTALENTILPSIIGKFPVKKSREKAKELLTFLGLENRLHHKPGQMSGGEQQRVAIARAMINDPKIILADEPTGNLDDSISNELFDLIFRLREERNQTFLIVTHNTELAQQCDRTLYLSHGKLTINN